MDLDSLSPDPRVQAVNTEFTKRRLLVYGVHALSTAVGIGVTIAGLIRYNPENSLLGTLFDLGVGPLLVVLAVTSFVQMRGSMNKAHAKAIDEATGRTPPPMTL